MKKSTIKMYFLVFLILVISTSAVTLLFSTTPMLDEHGELVQQSLVESQLEDLSKILIVLASLGALALLGTEVREHQVNKPKNIYKETEYKHLKP